MRSLAHRHRLPFAAAMLGGSIAVAGCAANPPSPQHTDAAAAHTITFTISGQRSATRTALPWSAINHIPLGADGINLTVQLDAHGGQAICRHQRRRPTPRQLPRTGRLWPRHLPYTHRRAGR